MRRLALLLPLFALALVALACTADGVVSTQIPIYEAGPPAELDALFGMDAASDAPDSAKDAQSDAAKDAADAGSDAPPSDGASDAASDSPRDAPDAG
jgi:hypothetical protein